MAISTTGRSVLLALTAAAGLGLWPEVAAAREVYLNGVKLGADVLITNQTFSACDVKIDDKGDVYITAKGVKVDLTPARSGEGARPATSTAAATPPPAQTPGATAAAGTTTTAALSKRYWLVTTPVRAAKAQYDVEVFVNGRFVKKVRAGDEAVILEVTRFVRVGDNVVELVARKNLGEKRLSSSPTDSLEIIVGEGEASGGTISITKPVVSFVRTAQDMKSSTDTTHFTGR
jgi:hypothetical protein